MPPPPGALREIVLGGAAPRATIHSTGFGTRCSGRHARIRQHYDHRLAVAVGVEGIRADDSTAASAVIRTDCGTGVS